MTRSLDRNKMIVIMYKDVLSPDVPKPVVISHLLETRTYIEWNETAATAPKLFWKKLRRALHSRQRVTNHRPVPIVRISASTHSQDGGESLAKEL